MSKMPEKIAQHTVDNYRCSRCWGFLVKTWAVDKDGQLEKTAQGEQLAEVKCRSSGEDFGFVSKYFVDQETAKDFNYSFEVRRDLSRMGIIAKEKVHAFNL